jgi:mannose-1-phosphate guanylyltransferase
MLMHTIDRVKTVIEAGRVVTIVNRDHLTYSSGQLRDHSTDNVIIQPENRDTASGILFPLIKILKRDPEAIVAIFPSDHFIKEEDRFRDYLRVSVSFVSSRPDVLIMLGAVPDGPERSYGWIQPGQLVGTHREKTLYTVEGFWEKPTIKTVQALYGEGCLWNTMIFVARAESLFQIFRKYTPRMYRSFQEVQAALDSSTEESSLNRVFAELPSADFSRAILERNPQILRVIPMKGVYWSDWGDESRIISDCNRFGLTLREELLDERMRDQEMRRDQFAKGALHI